MATISGMSAVLFGLALGTEAMADSPQRASGTFEVKVTPVAGADTGVAAARLSIEKTFAGDLIGTSRADMWTADTAVEGSAGYVAVEKVEGALRGHRGSFKLLHQGTMRRGADFQIRIVVVPESGTDQLTGLAGTMSIRIEGKAHYYDFDYTLPEAR
jgi:hypothetical protein